LPHVLFAYRVSPQETTHESPFFLLYGRDPQLPTEAALSQPKTRYQVDLDDYKTKLFGSLSHAWELARSQVKKAQQKQKYYDRNAKEPRFKEGDRVFVYMPSEKKKKGKAHKFARPFYGPYRVIEVTANDVKVVPVHKPRSTPIFVALDRVRFCPDEVPPDQYWPARHHIRKDHPIETSDDVGLDKLFPDGPEEPSPTRSWKGRLRPRPCEDPRN